MALGSRFLRAGIYGRQVYILSNEVCLNEFLLETVDDILYSWVGSVQLMLVLSVGLISGRLYDTGYLYVLAARCFHHCRI